MILVGLYFVLWGKYKENEIEESSVIIEAVKGINGNNQMMIIVINDIEMSKNSEKIISTAPVFSFPMLTREAPKS